MRSSFEIEFVTGSILFENATKVNWTDVRESVPIFLVTAIVPFTNSIFYGAICGLFMHVLFLACTSSFWQICIHNSVTQLSHLFRGSSYSSEICVQVQTNGVVPSTQHSTNTQLEPLHFENPYFDFEPSSPVARNNRNASNSCSGGISDYDYSSY